MLAGRDLSNGKRIRCTRICIAAYVAAPAASALSARDRQLARMPAPTHSSTSCRARRLFDHPPAYSNAAFGINRAPAALVPQPKRIQDQPLHLRRSVRAHTLAQDGGGIGTSPGRRQQHVEPRNATCASNRTCCAQPLCSQRVRVKPVSTESLHPLLHLQRQQLRATRQLSLNELAAIAPSQKEPQASNH